LLAGNFEDGFDTALWEFDFPILDMPHIGLFYPEGPVRTETKIVKNKRYNEIIELYISNKRPYSMYAVTGFYDIQDPLYKEIKETYAELAFEDTDETTAAHWVSSDGLYHRFIYFKEETMIDQVQLENEVNRFRNTYEKSLQSPPGLPSYVLSSAFMSFSKERNRKGISSSEIDYSKNNVKLTVIKETTIEEAQKMGDTFFAKLVEFVKAYPAYDEERWATTDFTVQFVYQDMADEIMIEGKKEGSDRLAWHGSIAFQDSGVVTGPNDGPLSIEDAHVIADKKVESINKRIPEHVFISGIEGAYKLDINGDGYPEIFTMEKLQTTTEVAILSYDQKKNDWVKIYSDATSQHFDGTDSLRLMAMSTQLTGDFKAQVYLGKISGSGGYLSFYVIGEDKKGNIKVLLDRMNESYPQGELLVDDLSDMKIYIKSYGEVVETLTAGDFVK